MVRVVDLMESDMRKFLEDSARKGVQNNTENGRCIQCGMCCPDILPVTEDELIVIKGYITQNDVIPIRQIKFDSDGHPAEVNLECPFRDDKNKKCLIYPVRPRICRIFICSQTPEVIAQNQIDCAKHRRKSLFVSFHITFLDDAVFAHIYNNHPDFKNTAITFASFEIINDAEE